MNSARASARALARQLKILQQIKLIQSKIHSEKRPVEISYSLTTQGKISADIFVQMLPYANRIRKEVLECQEVFRGLHIKHDKIQQLIFNIASCEEYINENEESRAE